MSARPPRASTRGENTARRARTRGGTHGERPERPERPERGDKRRAATAVTAPPVATSSGSYERVADDEILEVTELPQPSAPPALRMVVLEAAPHLAAAQSAIVAAGHSVVIGAGGRDGVDKLRFALGDVDALLVGMPGGEPLIEAAQALGAARPVVVAAWTGGSVEAGRRTLALGADLVTVRPHHVERLAPILLAAGQLLAQRRRADAAAANRAGDPGNAPGGNASAADVESDVESDAEIGPEIDIDLSDVVAPGGPAAHRLNGGGAIGDGELEPDAEPAGFLPAELFAQAVQRELERARRYGYSLAVAVFALDAALPPPPPPPGLRGILRARAGNALVHALRDIDLATELDQDRFLVVMPHTDRIGGADVARRLIGAVAATEPVTAVGRSFPIRVIGAVTAARPGEPAELPQLVHDANQLLEQAQVTGASLAVET